MSLAEVADYLGPPQHKQAVAAYCTNLQWCEALVFVYPTWWSGQPAMLMGWLDRVLIRGVRGSCTRGRARITPRLTNVRRLVTVTTHGSSKFINLLEGETGRRVIGNALRLCAIVRRGRRGWRCTTSTGSAERARGLPRSGRAADSPAVSVNAVPRRRSKVVTTST